MASNVGSDEGVDALSLRQLARDVGVSHAAPSRHFTDKHALAVAGFDRLTDTLGRAGRRGRSFRGRVRAMAAAYVEFAITEADLLDLMFTGKHSPGDVRPGDTQRIALGVLAAVHGFASLAASGMVPGDQDHALTDVVDTVVRGVRP